MSEKSLALIGNVAARKCRGEAVTLGLSTFIGPAIAGVFLPIMGISGVMWLFALMYIVAAAISYTLRLPGVRALR